jgi:hypothetical protein
MRASAHRFLFAFLSFATHHRRWVVGAIAHAALFGCTLITDVDREKIPEPPQPPFPEVDAGPGPDQPTLDASVPGDAGADASGEIVDAAAPGADAAVDAAVDASDADGG